MWLGISCSLISSVFFAGTAISLVCRGSKRGFLIAHVEFQKFLGLRFSFSMRSRVTYHLWSVHMLSPYTHDVLCVVLLVPCSCVDATLCVVVTGRGACMAGERQFTDQAPDTCGWGAICGVSRASVRVSFVWGYEDVSSFCNWKPPNK